MVYDREQSVTLDPGRDLVFQITNWYTCDDSTEDDEAPQYLVKVFGVTEDGRSVSANLTEFPPFFYVKCPFKINDYQLRMIKEHVVEKIYPPKLRNGVLDVKLMQKKDFWGFTNNAKFTFIRLSFKNISTFRAAAKLFTKKLYIRDFGNDGVFLKLYENNIDPFLRLAHIKNIDPAGWVRLPAKTYSKNNEALPTRCQIDVTARWSAIESVHLEKMAPLVIAAFDIECTSSHGDFPVAMKTYKKTALELHQAYNAAPEDYPKERVYKELMAVFDHGEKGALSKVYPKRYVNPKDLERPLTMHLDDIYNALMGRMHIRTPAPQARPVFGISSVPQKERAEMTRDAILKALTDILGKIFPPLEGDPIIQIGTTVHSYGEKECSVKHIVTLGSCDPIEGAIVEACKTERDLLLKWRDLVTSIDPDIMIGYNIFGFDMSYMYERAKELGIDRDFSQLGRIKDHVEIMYGRDQRYCPLQEKMLSSSALGDNLLRYIDIEGRVLIDMMKVVQRDHKLDSYKLDAVSSHFLGGKVLSCFENVAVFDNVKGITPESYVKLSGDAAELKHRVVNIQEMPEGQKGFRVELDPAPLANEKAWGLAKDDISPREIFESQAGSSSDRARIARYCIKDCALCNYLLMKLETLANNVGMANVCSVPLSYIFMRGQGIKIFSLVAKKCREDDYLIPCLTKYQNRPEEEEEDEEGYEGAIVLDPKEGIYLDTPISVLDYASLYPSSMISENLSHDCIVLDSKYDNLPGFEYLDICYDIYEKQDNKKVKTGVRTCRFVQLPEKGVIPRILMHLLKQRKLTRKKIEFETVTGEAGIPVSGLVSELEDAYKVTALDGTVTLVKKPATVEDTYDDFQKAVLDGLQNAYKVTANSLYGQCGARTSQIYMKDVAACTTATGRKMIILARDFILRKEVPFRVDYEPEIVYGDSVTGDTPLVIRYPDGHIDIKTIDSITSEWAPYQNFKPWDEDRHQKEQSFIDAEVWADGEWAKIHRVIRHKTNKKLYRVNTFEGCVDVTEDHSLVSITGEKLSPKDIVLGETMVSHTFPTEFSEFEIKVPVQGEPFQKETGVMKTCNTCKNEYDEEMFYMSHNKRANKCKLCVKEHNCKRMGKEFDGTIGEKILKYYVPSYTVTKYEAWVWGIFFGDGSCGHYDCPSSEKNTWAINNSNLKYLEIARKYLLATEPSDVVKDFKVLDTMESSGAYKLVPVGSIKYMVEKYRPLLYDKEDYKKVPDIILNAPYEVRLWFMKGYLAADGTKGKKGIGKGRWEFACLGKIGAQSLYYLMKSLGWKDIRVNIQSYKENTYWISNMVDPYTIYTKKNKVLKIFDIGDVTQETFVYDIETSHGKFHGGVGSIKLFNTDSIFSAFHFKNSDGKPIIGKEAVPLSRELGIAISNEIKKIIKPPHDLEWEKLFWPFILFSKKRYCANKYEHDDNKYKFNSMGIVLKRRDNAHIVKTIYGGVIDIIMNRQDIPASIEFLNTKLQELVDGKFPMEELIITKSLKSDYKDPLAIAHKVLADRMGERDEGSRPQVNDRIPFVYIQTPPAPRGKKVLQGERIEHPDYIRANNIKPDYEFYITNQIMTPVLQLYALVLEDLKGYKHNVDYKQVKEKLLKEKDDPKKAIDKYKELRETEVKKLLFDPILIKLQNKRSGNRQITDFFGAAKTVVL